MKKLVFSLSQLALVEKSHLTSVEKYLSRMEMEDRFLPVIQQ
jgi:hypothetical protein